MNQEDLLPAAVPDTCSPAAVCAALFRNCCWLGLRSKFDKFTMVDPLGADEEEVRSHFCHGTDRSSRAVRLQQDDFMRYHFHFAPPVAIDSLWGALLSRAIIW